MKKKSVYILILTIVAIGAWSIFLHTHGITAIVESVGVKNGYIILFLVALLGGVSSLGAVAYITALLTLSAGGLDPFYLALASGLGVSVGDTIYFFLGKKGLRTLILRQEKRTPALRKFLHAVTSWLDKKPEGITFGGIFILAAFTPTPNDLIAIAFGLAGRRYLTTISALVLGNIVHTYLIATVGRIAFFL
jgi:membrane protein DedA with SNARE-associated domain